MTIFDVKFKKSIEKEIKKLEKSNPKVAEKIIYFIFSHLDSSQNQPFFPMPKL